MVVEEFTTKFEIELAFKMGNALLDMLRLYADVLVVVETKFHRSLRGLRSSRSLRG